ncbi:MucR family transcriptional regulator [Pseudomonas sp.]|uniref:MucR family transcriptional regulator n=1 Tax=Pseudomonas sp. TaxID=306 RepID=UPI003D0C88E9
MPEHEALLEMTADIVTSMVSNNAVSPDQLPDLIGSVHTALAALGQAAVGEMDATRPEPAVSVRKSLSNPDFIISMIDGKRYKMLTRHIGLHGYTAETYRQAFGLRPDYPMVAPTYTEKRRSLAKSIGLGRKKGVPEVAITETPADAASAEPPAPAAKKVRRTRKVPSALKDEQNT